jgi:hypothetical protein
MAMEHVAIVSGLPRSGTSLMMQMIDAGGIPAISDGQRIADIDNPRGYFEFERVKKIGTDYLWLDDARGQVVKMVDLLLLELPLAADKRYRVVMMRRNMSEVIASQSKMLQRLGRRGAAIGDEQLATVFTQHFNTVQSFIASHPQTFQLLDVSFNDLINDPSKHAARVDVFLGGGMDVGKMAAAVDVSLYRNRMK